MRSTHIDYSKKWHRKKGLAKPAEPASAHDDSFEKPVPDDLSPAKDTLASAEATEESILQSNSPGTVPNEDVKGMADTIEAKKENVKKQDIAAEEKSIDSPKASPSTRPGSENTCGRLGYNMEKCGGKTDIDNAADILNKLYDISRITKG